MADGGPADNNGNGRLRDAQLQTQIERLDIRLTNLTGSVEALRLGLMDLRGGIQEQVDHISEMVHENAATIHKFCAVDAVKWENHKELHSREQNSLRAWSGIVSVVTSILAAFGGRFGQGSP